MGDMTVKCPKCNKGYIFKNIDKADKDKKTLLTNKINLNPKILCKCGNIYAWSQAKHTFFWSIPA